MKFGDLHTGEIMELAGQTAVLMAIESPHPKNPRFSLFVWFLLDDERFTFDMLDPKYELMPGSRIRRDAMMTWTRIVSKGTAR